MVYASVVIPVYNEEKDILECLRSLKKQSYKNFGVIIVDDGSDDKTLEIVKDTSKKERLKIRVLKQKHAGPGKARNLGAEKAKGEILVFIDADMTFDKDYLKNLIRPLLDDKKIIGTTHNYEIATNTGNKWNKLWGEVRVSKENAKDVRIFRAIRRGKFLEMGGFDPKYGYADDQTFWFKYGIKPIVAENTICYHKNPDTLKGTYKQARWIGASWKKRFFVFNIPLINCVAVLTLFLLLPFFILLKVFKTKAGNKLKYAIKDLLKFFSVKFYGYCIGILRAVYFGMVWK